ncbi:MAG: SPOR domain-containing protein [Zoogloeaceae bacterium]|jgi:hypothetical protein|nr:SPOR domain-containing protein [Zoogloeaceae bacterium]
MRILFFLLLFANLLFFAFSQGYFGKKSSPDAHRLEKQVNPERLRLAQLPDGTPADKASDGEVSVSAAASPEVEADAAVPPAAPAAANVPPACIRMSGLTPDVAVQLAGQATILRLKATQHDAGGWWVFIPPQSDRAAAEKKADELTQLGVKDFFINNSDNQKFAISLGIFSGEEAAQRHLAQLREKGVRSARVGPRRLENAQLEIRGDPLVVAVFREALPAGVTVRDCP